MKMTPMYIYKEKHRWYSPENAFVFKLEINTKRLPSVPCWDWLDSTKCIQYNISTCFIICILLWLERKIINKYTKSLVKNQVYAIVHMRDIRKNVLPKFIKLCMETPCLCPFQGHKYGRRKPTETSLFEFSYLCVNSSREELIKIKVVFIFILRQGMFR